jgi:hypothetical protein
MSNHKLPDVSSQYGAPMGRRTHYADDRTTPRAFRLRRVVIDSGGYDNGGAYWGFGAPLYRYESFDGDAEGYLRAADREAAKAAVRETYPRATFPRWRDG